MHVTFFQDQKAQTLVTDDLPLEKIKALVLGTQAKSKVELPWIKLAVFGDKRSETRCLRHDGNVLQITGVELDYDDKKVSLAAGVKIARKNNLEALFYTSPSYKKNAPKWRLLVPTSRALPPETRRPLAEYINKMFGGIFARESLTLSQAYYFGHVGAPADHTCVIVKGNYVDLDSTFAEYCTVKPPLDVDKALADMARGNIHNTQLAVTGKLVNAGRPIDEIVALVLAATKRVGKEHWNWKKEERDLIKMCETWAANAAAEKAAAAAAHAGEGINYADFVAYLPDHTYYFLPTREAWPAASVNSQLKPQTIVNGAHKPVVIPAHTWLDKNAAVQQMVWAPGLPTVIRDRLVSDGGWIMRPATSCLNLYRPPAIAREAGAGAERWLDLVKKVYPDNVDHLLRFFAQRVQRPEVKINHGLVLGGAPGVGKDTILEGLKHAIGPWNFAEISPAHLLGTFNSFIKSVVLRVSEARDLGEANRYSFHDHTKTLMSAPPDVLRCNEKFTHEHAVFNVTGVIITTNHKTTGLYLPEDDRRHYVAWSKCVKEDFEEDFWREFWGWYYTGGLECVAGYLHEYDLRDFDPKAPPVKTEAFWAIVDANRGPEESEAADAIEKLGRPPALTLDMLVGAADYSFGTFLSDRKNRRIIPHRLEKIGYVPVANPDNKQRLWVVPDPLTKHTKQQMIYARNELPLVDQLAAVRALISPKK